ncbi:MAG: ExeM/NucH family extracellular endonuclease [Actinomycetia bacterium]|nr:ExeM/NucH family extracellular endonuclease [Actinomycetes bacterium]
MAVLAALLTTAIAPAAHAATVVVASDLTGSASVNLISFTNSAPAFSDPDDGFDVFQRGVSSSIPFVLLDDTISVFPADSQGIIDENVTGPFFGMADTENGDNAGPVTATWVFDISGASNLQVDIDIGAMGDFEAADSFEFATSIDGGPTASLFSLVADEAASRTYTLASGATFTLNDPLNAGAVPLSNVLQTLSAPLAGTGSQLTLTMTALTNGGGEGVAFRNIVVSSGDGAGGPAVGDLVITEVMQNPSAVSDSNGEWFEVKNQSGAEINLDGWMISDAGTNSHVISGEVKVPAGGYAVLGINAVSSANGGVAVDYEYSGMFLANSDDEVILTSPGAVEFDRIEYDGGPLWPDPIGASMNLDPPSTEYTSNDDGANWCEGSASFGAGDRGTPGADNTTCETDEPELELIHNIQGSDATVAIGGPVKAQGIVTSLFERDDVLDGFFLQEEDLEADADPDTSEGIFVYCRGNCPAAIATGDVATVIGSATDFQGMSQIDMTGGSVVIESSANPLPTPASVDLPASGPTIAESTFEGVEGMLVTFPDTLAVSEYFQLARFGQIVLTESSRPFQFTHDNAPSVAGYAAFLDDLAQRRIILDDNSNDNNDAVSDGPDEAYYYPEGGLSVGNRFRGGDTITALTGVIHWSWAGSSGTEAWRIRPVPDAYDYTFTPANQAPAAPAPVGGSTTVASMNVLNYFTTIDVTSSGSIGDCGPSGTLDCRGADSSAELDRQRAKIVAAMLGMDADVLGLVELENDGDDASIVDLVAGLNGATAPGTYDHIATGFIGDDAIKVGLIYQPASVAPLGDFAILDSSVDPTFIDTKNRPVLIQTFVENTTQERFTVAVNHLKSKGSPCDDVGDPGLNDGQANCPGTRAAAATALANYLDTDPTNSGDPDFLIMGDLNAYASEDAITALTGVGYTDLMAQFQGSGAYSYVFDGQLGYLDHGLANGSLLPQITGATPWHINADEINVFDYNDDNRDAGESSWERESGVLPTYDPDPLRSSDHDPLVMGLGLDSIPDNPTCQGRPATIIGTPGDDVIVGTSKADVIMTFGGNDEISGGNGNDVICSGYGDDTVNGGNGKDRINGEQGNDTIDGGNGKDTVNGGAGSDEIRGGNGKDSLDGGDGSDNGDGGRGVDSCANFEVVLNCER